MVVKELIKILQEENQEATVLLASDPEGNSFHMVEEAGPLDVDEDLREDVLGLDNHIISAICIWP